MKSLELTKIFRKKIKLAQTSLKSGIPGKSPKVANGIHLNHLRFFDGKKFEMTLSVDLTVLKDSLQSYFVRIFGNAYTIKVLFDSRNIVTIVCEPSHLNSPNSDWLMRKDLDALACFNMVAFKIRYYLDKEDFGVLIYDYWGLGPDAKKIFESLSQFCRSYLTLGFTQDAAKALKLNEFIAFCSLNYLCAQGLFKNGVRPRKPKIFENLGSCMGILIDVDIEENQLLLSFSGDVNANSEDNFSIMRDFSEKIQSQDIYSENDIHVLNAYLNGPEMFMPSRHGAGKANLQAEGSYKEIYDEYGLRNNMLQSTDLLGSELQILKELSLVIQKTQQKTVSRGLSPQLEKAAFLVVEFESLRQSFFYISHQLADFIGNISFLWGDFKSCEYYWKLAQDSVNPIGIVSDKLQKLKKVHQVNHQTSLPTPDQLPTSSESKGDLLKQELYYEKGSAKVNENNVSSLQQNNLEAENRSGELQNEASGFKQGQSEKGAVAHLDAIDWRKLARDNRVGKETPENILMSKGAELDKHLGMQVTSLLSGEMASLSKWTWPIWQSPDSAPYSFKSIRKYPAELIPKFILSNQGQALIFLSRIFALYYHENFGSQYLMAKLRVDQLNLNKLAAPIPLNEGLSKDAALVKVLGLTHKKLAGAFSLMGLGSEIFYHARTRCIYIDMPYYQKAPVSYLFHRLFVTVVSLNLGYYNILRLDPLQQVARLVHLMHNHLEADFLGRLTQSLDSDSKKLTSILKKLESPEIRKAVSLLMPLSTKDWMIIHQQMWQHLYSQSLAMHLDLVGLLEYLTQKKIREKNFLSIGEIYSLHSLAPLLIKVASNLAFTTTDQSHLQKSA